MSKALRALALLTFAAGSMYAVPPKAVFIPKCFILPDCNFPASGWTYSHQCMQGTTVRYVYANAAGNWCLYGPVLP